MSSNNYFLDYTLPKEKIASRPIGRGENRSLSKLLYANFRYLKKDSLKVKDEVFFNLSKILKSGDLLILNNSKVFPSRFFVNLSSLSSKKVEVLLTRRLEKKEDIELWEAMAKPMKQIKKNISFSLSSSLKARSLGRNKSLDRVILEITKKDFKKTPNKIEELLSNSGLMPIPPYIRDGKADDLDRETYQTVLANKPGSVACPTAGLHFSKSLLEALKEKGVRIETITLHVGTASFSPIRNGNIEEHKMQKEYYSISDKTAKAIFKAKKENRRVIAVGTTCVRSLESAVRKDSYSMLSGDEKGLENLSEEGRFLDTNLFITPGFKFKVVDCLITNFHQPLSTHLLLVDAFSGSEIVELIYNHALKGDYRFLSYGDSMFLEKKS